MAAKIEINKNENQIKAHREIAENAVLAQFTHSFLALFAAAVAVAAVTATAIRHLPLSLCVCVLLCVAAGFRFGLKLFRLFAGICYCCSPASLAVSVDIINIFS